MPVEDYRIGVGYNVALVDLVNIELIIPTGDIAFYPPNGYWHHSPGVRKGRGNGLGFYAGYDSVRWQIDVVTQKQNQYLRDTYCSGGFSGQVTIYTRIGTIAYARFNAVMDLPETQNERQLGNWFEGYQIVFTRLIAL